LSGDPRTTPARPDLAARSLEGRVPAARYVDPRTLVCAVPCAAIRRGPDVAAEQDDELLFGELFDVLEEDGGWCWGQAARDGYVGYLAREALGPPPVRPTHRVAAMLVHAFAEPDVRSAARGPFLLNSLVCVEAQEGRFLKGAGAGWFVAERLAPVGVFEADATAVAERFMGAPYLWGGRTGLGVDCSGLVQAAMYACGRGCPRDSDQQAACVGRPIAAAEFGRGDLVFWSGHVAIGLSPDQVLHANSAAMAVSAEPLDGVLARNRAIYGEPTAWRRL
jgi:hypothetical protein